MAGSMTGQVVDGYTIGPLLGSGGMGEVYHATPPDGSEPVAIKFLRAEIASEPEIQARFVREIRLMQALQHDYVLPVYKHGIFNNELYFTMRLINGMTLRALCLRRSLTVMDYWPILDQVSQALAYARTKEAIHRDLKPENIFIERGSEGQEHVFLGDFGLGKQLGVDNTLTAEGTVMGTPNYLAPECALGERADHRSDIYSLAIVSFETLLNTLPFKESHAHLTAIAHVTKPVPKPTSINPDFPASIERVLLMALEKDREYRYQKAEDFAQSYHDALMSLSEEDRNRTYRVN